MDIVINKEKKKKGILKSDSWSIINFAKLEYSSNKVALTDT